MKPLVSLRDYDEYLEWPSKIDRPSKVVSLGRRDASVIVRLQEGLSCHRGFNDRLYIRLSLASRFQSYCMAPISHNELSPVDWYFIDV